MKRKKSGWNIVIAGFWNRMIFTPEWVSPRLFPERTVDTIVTLLPVLPLVYRVDEVALEVTSTRLNFRPLRLSDDASLLRAESMARKAIESLPETPIQAVGINFSFKEESPSEDLIKMFNDSDDVELAQQNWSIGERKITKKLTKDSCLLNLTKTFHDGMVSFDFNFHVDTTTSEGALAAITAGRVVQLKETALQLLSGAYRLELESDGDIDE